MRAHNLEQMISRCRRAVIVEINARGMTYKKIGRYEQQEFEPVCFDPEYPSWVGNIGMRRVFLNNEIIPAPRMQVSAEFRLLQHYDLVRSTDEWLYQFFGTYYPIYISEDRITIRRSELQAYIDATTPLERL